MLTYRTFAVVTADPVVADAAVQAVALQTVVLVRLAVLADEAVDADALVAALRVLAGALVLAGVVGGALVHVVSAVLAAPVGRAAARVRVDAVHARGAMLAQMARAVVDVLVAVIASKSCTQADSVSRKPIGLRPFHSIEEK